MPPPKLLINSIARFMGHACYYYIFVISSFTFINESNVVIMFADIVDNSFLSKIFKVKAPAAPLESVASPDAPVAQTFKSPIAGHRRSKFSNPAQQRSKRLADRFDENSGSKRKNRESATEKQLKSKSSKPLAKF